MMKIHLKLALGTTLAAGIALSAASAFAENPFSAQPVTTTTTLAAADEAKCGSNMDGNCGSMKKTATGTEDVCPADTNKDGKVSKEEFMKFHEKLFDEADTNKDGVLDASERKAMHAKMMDGSCGGSAKAAPATATPAAPTTAAKPAATDKK